MDFNDRKQATLDVMMELDPYGHGGVYSVELSERVAFRDTEFMKRLEIMHKARRLLGIQSRLVRLGARYERHMLGVLAELEHEHSIEATWVEMPDNQEVMPRRVYRNVYGEPPRANI